MGWDEDLDGDKVPGLGKLEVKDEGTGGGFISCTGRWGNGLRQAVRIFVRIEIFLCRWEED